MHGQLQAGAFALLLPVPPLKPVPWPKDVELDATPTPSDEFVSIAKVGDIPAGEGRCYPVHGRMIAVFFSEGEYFALDDVCPHMGASLAGGWAEGRTVTCPWHAWRFCGREGVWLDNPRSPLKVGTYELRIEGDEILVRVPK